LHYVLINMKQYEHIHLLYNKYLMNNTMVSTHHKLTNLKMIIVNLHSILLCHMLLIFMRNVVEFIQPNKITLFFIVQSAPN